MKYIVIIALAALTISSCSLLQSPIKDKRNSNAVQVEIKDDNKTKAKFDLPAAPAVPGNRPSQSELCGAQWLVAAVGSTKIELEEDVPYICFEMPSSRFYANDGCNYFNGNFVLKSDGNITLSSVLSTLKYCPDKEYSALIGNCFKDGSTYSVDYKKIGQDSYLYLRDSNNHVVMTLRRHNMEFLNGNWQVTSIDDSEINDEEANIFIDIPELKIHGNTGCNYFNGTIYIDPSRSNAIDFSEMAVTKMACPKTKQETAMLVALERTSSAIAGKNDKTVLLLDNKGKVTMTLKRIAPQND